EALEREVAQRDGSSRQRPGLDAPGGEQAAVQLDLTGLDFQERYGRIVSVVYGKPNLVEHDVQRGDGRPAAVRRGQQRQPVHLAVVRQVDAVEQLHVVEVALDVGHLIDQADI